jgi:hypothetical protein
MYSLRGSGGIFISYRREETAAQAGRLYDHLRDHFGEDRVFMDVDSITVGVDFTTAITEALSGCDILLAIMGRNWSAITDSKGQRRLTHPDDLVRIEIETAPVLVEGAVLPQTDDLPPSLRALIRRQAFGLSHAGFRSEVKRLIAGLDQVLDVEPGRSAMNADSRTAAPGRKGEAQLSGGTRSRRDEGGGERQDWPVTHSEHVEAMLRRLTPALDQAPKWPRPRPQIVDTLTFEDAAGYFADVQARDPLIRSGALLSAQHPKGHLVVQVFLDAADDVCRDLSGMPYGRRLVARRFDAELMDHLSGRDFLIFR